jgi:formamidopyrimidine-DNA glycosylase
MTGFLAVRGAPRLAYVNTDTGAGAGADAPWPPRFAKLVLTFDGAPASKGGPPLAAAYADARRFGRVTLVADPVAALVAPLGPDALALPAGFGERLRARGGRRPIKTVLLDQALLAGVGNWVADDVLLEAGVHPETAAGALSEAQAARVAAAVESVCAAAVAVGGDAARFPPHWLFHVRWDPKATGARAGVPPGPVSWITLHGRTTAYVPSLQRKGEGAPPATAKAAPKAKAKAAPTRPRSPGAGAGRRGARGAR